MRSYVPCDEDALVVLAGHLLLGVDVDGEDGVAPRRVLVHHVSSDRTILKAYQKYQTWLYNDYVLTK